MPCAAIILTGGNGSRITEIGYPKQFYEILYKPVFVHTLEIYEYMPEIDDIYLVINQSYSDKYHEVLQKYTFRKLRKLIPGGATRQESVENAVLSIKNTEMVVIQDGADPTTHPEGIRECIKTAEKEGACTAFASARHTVVKISGNEIESVLDRELLGYTVAPQVYRFELVLSAITNARKNNLTNKSIVELVKEVNHKVVVVPSKYENIKITRPEDLIIVEQILKKRNHVYA